MPTLELSDAQVVELVKQLSPERQREALVALAEGAAAAARRADAVCRGAVASDRRRARSELGQDVGRRTRGFDRRSSA